jgi:hypothetical protein
MHQACGLGFVSRLASSSRLDRSSHVLQIIGLIIAVYAIFRLIQVPIEMTATREEVFKVPYLIRLAAIAGISLFGVMALGVLTLMLLLSGSPRPMDF